ncbi:nucleotidyltransferase family protein [Desulfurivibrio dismutans]|uniref:nucleotidyltransferase family protein n=1 Tax=Desulfurivibrio dismutans TaxID=1398908 RepID=UPI0023DC089C|nr:nucleotidyltransferase family protein [Desulfurivibrio alkaliphilus]MDF1613502.1 nucleotidyltransferase family protein [Desulfurivibrio alkaliphilus]
MNKDWRDILVPPTLPILETMRQIDKTAMQIALVVDENQVLLGTVTDGDIRRAILKGGDLGEPVEKIMNRQPTTFRANESRKDMLVAMRLLKFTRVPLVDEENRVVGLQVLDNLLKPAAKDNPVVLMAGGLGTRLGPLTKDCPKPLLNVGGQPVLQTILESFIECGFQRFYFSVNYKASMIEEFFGDGSKWNVEIHYLHEDKKLGTAGALSLLPEKPTLPLVVMNGDILTKVNFQQLLDFHTDNRAAATMCVHKYDLQIPYGVVNVEKHRLTNITEKPVQSFFINAGIYVLEPKILEYIPADTFFDMPQLFDTVLQNKQEAAVFPLREYWLDIGHMTDFERAQGEFGTFFAEPKE